MTVMDQKDLTISQYADYFFDAYCLKCGKHFRASTNIAEKEKEYFDHTKVCMGWCDGI
jgi:hypothetical protein